MSSTNNNGGTSLGVGPVGAGGFGYFREQTL